MDKISRAKQVFFNTLKRNGISPEEYLKSDEGMSLVKRAAGLLADREPGEKHAIMGGVLEALARRMANPNDPIGKTLGAAALGMAGGYGSAAALGKLTSPTGTTIGNLQKKEMISEYDAAITELQNRLEANAL